MKVPERRKFWESGIGYSIMSIFLHTLFYADSLIVPCFGAPMCIQYQAVLPSPLRVPPHASSCLRSSCWLNLFHLGGCKQLNTAGSGLLRLQEAVT